MKNIEGITLISIYQPMHRRLQFAAWLSMETSVADGPRNNEHSRPLLELVKQRFKETLGKLSKKSDTAEAVRYALARWEALLGYVDDGRLGIEPKTLYHAASGS